MTARLTKHVVVRGRVQGVGFRAFVDQEARGRGLSGWVRNRRDGSVEAVFSGTPEKVEAMIEACRNGPPSSHVHTVEDRPLSEAERVESGSGGFVVLPTR